MVEAAAQTTAATAAVSEWFAAHNSKKLDRNVVSKRSNMLGIKMKDAGCTTGAVSYTRSSTEAGVGRG